MSNTLQFGYHLCGKIVVLLDWRKSLSYLWQTRTKNGVSTLKKLSVSEQVIAEKTVCILLVRGENPDGNGIYAYVAVRADKLEPFMAAQKSGTFYPEDFGVIIEAGEGEPSADVRKKMETEYGFNHQVMVDIPNAEKAYEITSNLRRSNEDGQR